MGTVGLQFAVIVVLMIASGFFAASEIAIVSARRGRLEQRAEAGSGGARAALQLAAEPNRFLATVQVGITLIGVVAAAFGGSVLEQPLREFLQPYVSARYVQPLAFSIVVLLITYLSLIIGELVPKRLALQNAELVAARVAPVMRFVSTIAAPAVWLLAMSTQGVLRLLGRANEEEEQVTEEDILSLVREGTAGGTLEVAERDLIERVFNFTDVTVRSIMTPRTEIFAVAEDQPLDSIVTQVIEAGFSRIPVYRGSLDTVVGILYAKDILRATQLARETGEAPKLAELLRLPVFVLEHQRITAVLQTFKQSRTHLALVLDEYGQTDGLLTLEDVLEQLMGDIADEYDEADTMVVQRPDGSWLVDGLLSYANAEQLIGLPARSELTQLPSFETVAGLLLALLEHIPTTGETAQLNDWHFEVVDMDGVRIDKILIYHRPLADPAAQTDSALALGGILPAIESRHEAAQKRNGQE